MHKLPTFYIPHGGGPCFFMDWRPKHTWQKMAQYLTSFADAYRKEIKAIVVVSAHWEDDIIKVTSHHQPDLIYDYYGFPENTYSLKWPAKGQPDLAHQIVEMLTEGGMQVALDAHRGFDHGVFIPFLLAFPEANIPTVQLSLCANLSPVAHLQIGKLLAPLREQGILIIGSGMSYHDVGALMGRSEVSGATEFDDWLCKSVLDPEIREEHLTNWVSAPYARACHPREEHLLPLHVVAGAASGEGAKIDYHETVLGAKITAFKFG